MCYKGVIKGFVLTVCVNRALLLLTILAAVTTIFTFFAAGTARAAGERLHNKLGRFQVKELPELWIPFLPSLLLTPAPPTCQDSFSGHKGRIHLNLRKHEGKEKKTVLQKKTGGGGVCGFVGLIAEVKKTRQRSTFCQNRRPTCIQLLLFPE